MVKIKSLSNNNCSTNILKKLKSTIRTVRFRNLKKTKSFSSWFKCLQTTNSLKSKQSLKYFCPVHLKNVMRSSLLFVKTNLSLYLMILIKICWIKLKIKSMLNSNFKSRIKAKWLVFSLKKYQSCIVNTGLNGSQTNRITNTLLSTKTQRKTGLLDFRITFKLQEISSLSYNLNISINYWQ